MYVVYLIEIFSKILPDQNRAYIGSRILIIDGLSLLMLMRLANNLSDILTTFLCFSLGNAIHSEFSKQC